MSFCFWASQRLKTSIISHCYMLQELQVFLFKKYKLSVWSFPANNDSKFHLVFLFIWTKTTADRFNCNLFSFFMRRKNLLLKHVITGGRGGVSCKRDLYKVVDQNQSGVHQHYSCQLSRLEKQMIHFGKLEPGSSANISTNKTSCCSLTRPPPSRATRRRAWWQDAGSSTLCGTPAG